jgi:DNA-damage-inducible protein J
MSKDIQINIRLESHLRDEAEKVLGKLGVSLGEAVKIFLNQVVLHNGFPFEIKIPNQETINAFKQTEHDKDKLKTYDSPKELFEEMDKW